MYRFLLTPRWLGINLFVLLAVPICGFLGTWQLSRFDARVASHHAAQREPAPGTGAAAAFHDLMPGVASQVTQATVGRVASVTGHYDQDRQFLVPGRQLDGRQGFYVLTPLRTDGGAVAVVRGWLPGDASHPGAVPPAPAGQVTVRGTLQAPESPGDAGVDASGGLPAGQLGMISAASLVNLVPYPVYNGWITLTAAQPPLKPVPPVSAPGSGFDMRAAQNLGYTGEWFVFAGFVVFMWIRLARREAETRRDLALGLIPADGEEPRSAGQGAAVAP